MARCSLRDSLIRTIDGSLMVHPYAFALSNRGSVMKLLSAFNVMGIRKRFMWASAFGVTSTVIIALAMMMFAEEKAMDAKLHQLSQNELTSLHALIVNVMAARPDDADDIGIDVFNNWFESRNLDYPGELWSAWGPTTMAYMKEYGDKDLKRPAMPLIRKPSKPVKPSVAIPMRAPIACRCRLFLA